MSDKNKYEHVSYYANGRKYEPIDVIQDWDLGFCLGNAVKYISRAGRKINIRDDDDLTGADICKAKISDLNKAKQYIQYEIDRINAELKNCVGDDSQRNTNDYVPKYNDQKLPTNSYSQIGGFGHDC